MAPRALVTALLSRLDDAEHNRVAALETLEGDLYTMWQEGVRRWGDLHLEAKDYAACLSLYIANRGTPGTIKDIDAAEVYIVAACIRNLPGALAAFEAEYFTRAVTALRKMSISPDDIDDILQVVRLRLLLPGDNGRCRLEVYLGRGDLRTLIRVVATRLAVDLQRRTRRHVPDDELGELPAADPDPRLLAVRRQCREHFVPAFRTALADLERRERNLLRLHIVNGVTLATLARSYGVHRATVVRWLSKAREQLLRNICKSLAEIAAVTTDEVAAIVAEIQSQLDLSLSRLMQTKS